MRTKGGTRRRWLGSLASAALVVVASSSASNAAPAVVLWGPTRAGMTEAEVRQLVPEARASVAPLPNQRGWVSLLRAHVRDGARDQNVEFSFKGGRLIGVVIMMGAPFGLEPIDGAAAKASFLSLRRTHGVPRRSFFTTDNFKAAQWIKDGRAVGYLERPPPDIAVMVFVNAEEPDDWDLFKDEKPAQIYPEAP